MGLAFDLAEAINLAVGAAAGGAVRPIEGKVRDATFRARLAQEAKGTIQELASVRTADLRRLFADTAFLDSAITGNFTAIDSDASASALTAAVFAGIDEQTARAIGAKLGCLYVAMAVQDAEPIDRVVFNLLSAIALGRDPQSRSTGLQNKLSQIAGSVEEQVGRGGGVRIGRIPVVNRWFLGRADALTELAAASSQGGRTVALTGMGGVGKTSIVATHALAEENCSKIVCWVRADSTEAITRTLSELGSALGLDLPRSHSVRERAEEVLVHLRTLEQRWLLVYDNVPERSGIEDWIPAGHRGCVVITSRNRHFEDVADVIEVEPLTASQSESFLAGRVNSSNPVAASDQVGVRAVALALSGLPLALEQAGAYVARSPKRTWQEYEALLQAVDLEFAFPLSTRPAGYPETIVTTWAVSVEAANRECSIARFVLQVMSYLASSPVPIAITEQLELAAEGAVADALTALHVYSLVTVQPDQTVQVHRLVQTVSRATAPPETLKAAVSAVLLSAPDDQRTADAWGVWVTVEDHVEHMLRENFDLISDDVDLVEGVLTKASILANAVANWRSPGQAAALAKAIADRVTDLVGDGHAAALRAKKNWAVTLGEAGDHSLAVEVLSDVLELVRAMRLSSTEDLVATVEALAVAYSRDGRLSEATELKRRWANVLGGADLDERQVLMRRSNTAFHLLRLGDFTGAYKIFKAVVPQMAILAGVDNADTMRARQGLALALSDLGNFPRSQSLLIALLRDKKRVLGSGHISTLRTWSTLASTTFAAGDPAEALRLAQEVLETAEESLGPDHPMSIDARQAMGVLAGAAGQAERAVHLLEECQERAQNAAIVDNQLRLKIDANLAAAYRQNGDLGRAITLLERVITAEEPLLGSGNPELRMHRAVLDEWTADASSADSPPSATPPGLFRNTRCPCGSGLKYKRCHGAAKPAKGT